MDIVQALQDQLREAKRQVSAIEKAISAFGNTISNNGRRKGKKRTMSLAARKKIAAAQRARWAKQKAALKS